MISFLFQSDAVASSMANQYNVSKSEIFDPESKNVAVRLALGETQIINKTKKYLEKVCPLFFDSFGNEKTTKNKKNIRCL
jgi:multiple RNA-binding domain-containing protein 1